LFFSIEKKGQEKQQFQWWLVCSSHGFDPKSQVKQNTITLVYSDSQLSTQHYGVRVKMFGSTHESV